MFCLPLLQRSHASPKVRLTELESPIRSHEICMIGDFLVEAMDLNDPKFWRDKAKEIRLLAADMQDEESKQTMLRIAVDFERLALLALERLERGGQIA